MMIRFLAFSLVLASTPVLAAGGGSGSGGAGSQKAINSGQPPGTPGPPGSPNNKQKPTPGARGAIKGSARGGSPTAPR